MDDMDDKPLLKNMVVHTFPETNIEPENRLEKEIPIGNHHFQVLCWFLGV